MAQPSSPELRAFVSECVVTPAGTIRAALLVEGERIRAICAPEELPTGTHVTDFGSCAILPGLVDTHVHINEPGRTEWEGFASATRAAAAGGYTLLVDMPLNCLPETATVEALDLKRAAAATGGVGGTNQCLIDWAAWGGCVAENQAHLLPLARGGVPGYKCFLIYPGCDGFESIDREQLERALPYVAASGLPLLVHAELAEPIDAAFAELNARNADWRRFSTYLASRPDEAELAAVRMMIDLCRRYRARIHIVHLASALALPVLDAARAEGLPITVEACPHHLHFAAEDIPDGATLLKCTPPIRSRANREALWQGLRAGSIDMVVTDHSPCPPEMKRADQGRFDLAWGGIASLSVAPSVVWTDACARGFTLADLARWMSSAPAALAGFSDRAGALVAGREANFTVFDPDASFTVTPDVLYTRHAVSPYIGATFKGRVEATYLRGDPVFERGVSPDSIFAAVSRGDSVHAEPRFAATPRGRELTLC